MIKYNDILKGKKYKQLGGYSKLYDDIIEKVKMVENGFKEIEKGSTFILNNNSVNKCFNIAKEFYSSEFYQVRELSTFICGSISVKSNEALRSEERRVGKECSQV